jgi:hypothetical protein
MISAGTKDPQFAAAHQDSRPDLFAGYDPDDVRRAKAMFTSGNNQSDITRQQIEWLEGRKQQAIVNQLNSTKPLIFPVR